jgi:hypothetical protein
MTAAKSAGKLVEHLGFPEKHLFGNGRLRRSESLPRMDVLDLRIIAITGQSVPVLILCSDELN